MKWMLVVLVFETSVVKTDLLFDNLGQCLAAEQEVREAYSRAFNAQSQATLNSMPDSDREGWLKFLESRLSRNPATCIPHQ